MFQCPTRFCSQSAPFSVSPGLAVRNLVRLGMRPAWAHTGPAQDMVPADRVLGWAHELRKDHDGTARDAESAAVGAGRARDVRRWRLHGDPPRRAAGLECG